MSQFGMQMPGGRGRRTAAMNIYTGLLLLAVVSLGVACGFMYMAAGRVGVNGQPFEFQSAGKVQLKAAQR